MGKFINILLSPIQKCFFTKKLYERRLKEQPKLNKFFYDKENGYHIGWANHWFGYFYSSYFGFFSFLLMGFIFKVGGDMALSLPFSRVLAQHSLC